jgi:hypothetical protein
LKPGASDSLRAIQVADKRVFYYAAVGVWCAGL